MRRAPFTIAAALVAAALASCGGSGATPDAGNGPSAPAPGLAATARLADPPLRPGVVLGGVEDAVGPVAVGGHNVYAAVGPVEAETSLPRLVVRTPDGHVRTVTKNIARGYGVAAGSDWVAYAIGAAPRLLTSRPDGSDSRVLATTVVAPVTARGELLAWAEQRGNRQRVIVRDMRSGDDWVAADMPRCGRTGCFRIDGVALAREGVTFVRGAIGPQASYIGRRRFAAARPEFLTVPDDPQPDLAPSSDGALFYVFGRGWERWDFGAASPQRAPFKGTGQLNVQGYENGRWLVLRQRRCKAALMELTPAHKHLRVVLSPDAVKRSAHAPDDVCVESLGIDWEGGVPVSAWAVDPPDSIEEHEDTGLGGVAIAGHPPR